jgi:hypothetical protein
MNGDIRLVLFRTVVRSGMEAAGMTKLHDHYDTLVEAGVPTGNYIAEFRQRNHRDPLPGELAMGRLGNYITYDSNRDPSTEYSVTSRWNLSNDQSGERRDIYPLGQPGMRVVSEQTNAERRQQLNQFGNQLGNAGRNFLNGVAQGGGRNVSQERPFDPRRLLFQNQRRK